MDERVMKKCVGTPIPEWNTAHRLHINRPTGLEIKNLGTFFGINSTFMDVIEPSLLDKQWLITGGMHESKTGQESPTAGDMRQCG